MDFSIICRLCMAKDGPMLDIAKDTTITAKAYALLPNLKLLDDGLPNGICRCCIYQLQAAYKFKRKCELTDIILRKHLQRMRSKSTYSNTNVPVEINIDSDDDNDDVENITEPLVALPSSVSLEDQDPLDLGREIKNLCDTYSCSVDSKTVRKETALYSRYSKTVLTANLHQSGVMCGNLDNSSTDIPKLEIKKSFNVDCCSVEQNSSDSAQVNSSAEEHFPVSQHFSNQKCEKMEYEATAEAEQYYCPVCSELFDSRYQMELHLTHHHGETPYPCPICKKGFRREGGLKAHLKVHTGDKPHICDVCNKAFSLKGNLKVHLRLHTGEKPFKCITCMKAFTQKISLTKHLSVHRAVH